MKTAGLGVHKDSIFVPYLMESITQMWRFLKPSAREFGSLVYTLELQM